MTVVTKTTVEWPRLKKSPTVTGLRGLDRSGEALIMERVALSINLSVEKEIKLPE